MADHSNQTVTMTMPMATNSIGIPHVTHTVVFNSENVACESVGPRESANIIQPHEIKTEYIGKEIKEECMDTTPNFDSCVGDMSALNGLMPIIDVKPQLGLHDVEAHGQLGLINIKTEDSEGSVEGASKENSLKVGQAASNGPIPFMLQYVTRPRPNPIEILPKPGVDLNKEMHFIQNTVASKMDPDHIDRFCEICNKLFECEGAYRRHVPFHNGKRSFACKVCPLRFLDEKGLRTHMKSHFADSCYPCVLCGRCFEELSHLQFHLKRIHPSKHKCADCGEMVRIADKKSHRHCKPKKSKKSTCSLCGKSYKDLKGLAVHKCQALLTTKWYPCRVCTKEFKLQNERDAHMTTHDRERNVACDLCEEYFSCAYYRDQHKKKEHPEANLKKCSYCGLEFKKRAPYLRHMSRHKKVDDRHQCDICGFRFKWKDRLTLHMAEVHDGPLPRKCEECGERFLTMQNLNDHRREKHPESDVSKSLLPPSKKGPSYQCKDCQKSFPKRKLLISHARQHNVVKTVKAFKCDFCDSTYKHEEGKVRHTWMKHGGPVPYTCKQCGEGFTGKGEMVEHIKALHGPQRQMGKETSEPSLVQVAAEGASECSSTELTYRSEQDKELTGQGDELNTGGTLGIKIKTEKPWDAQEDSHVCSDCGTAYTTKLRLMTHACSNPEHLTPLICPICLEGFKSQREFDGHMAMHSAED